MQSHVIRQQPEYRWRYRTADAASRHHDAGDAAGILLVKMTGLAHDQRPYGRKEKSHGTVYQYKQWQ